MLSCIQYVIGLGGVVCEMSSQKPATTTARWWLPPSSATTSHHKGWLCVCEHVFYGCKVVHAILVGTIIAAMENGGCRRLPPGTAAVSRHRPPLPEVVVGSAWHSEP